MINPQRARLPEQLERQFIKTDRKSAECYASMEDITYRLAVLAEVINSSDGVPCLMRVSDTLVTDIRNVKGRTTTVR